MQTLLAQFYSRIRGSQEDIASESLVYILSRSELAREKFIKSINRLTGKSFGDINFTSQSVGKDLERPDISGTDDTGNEVLLIEAKFWASLTSNQPVGYLNRLGKNSVLLFLVPTLRERPVFNEVVKRLHEEGLNIKVDSDNRLVDITDQEKQVAIISWNDVLEPIREVLEHQDDEDIYSDIVQLIGFCDTIDSQAFLPLTDEDFSPLIAKRVVSYVDLTEKVVDQLLQDNKDISVKGLNSTSKRYAFRRYFKNKEFGMSLCYQADYWSKYADTPFWLFITDTNEKGEWVRDSKFHNKVKATAQKLDKTYVLDGNDSFISIDLLTDVMEDEVIKDMARQVEEVLVETDNF